MNKGLVHVYTGAGKGKTTAAIGLCVRAAGHGRKSCIIQFMKGDINYGELEIARRLAPLMTIKQMGRPDFVDRTNPDPVDVQMARDALKSAGETVRNGMYDIVVLDEVNVALDFGLIELSDLLGLIRERPEAVELVLTGRNAHPEVIACADLVTDMQKVKHYYDDGIKAREGIEY